MPSGPCLVPGPDQSCQETGSLSSPPFTLTPSSQRELWNGPTGLQASWHPPPTPRPPTRLSTHMWLPGRSSLVSIPSFSISICRKVLTFCRVSSSEYLQGHREGEGCFLGFDPSPLAHSPSAWPQVDFPTCNELSAITPPSKALSTGGAQGLPILHKTSQTNSQTNK